MRAIKKIPVKTAVMVNVACILIVLAFHLLVIARVIPFFWINGGRSESFQAQRQLSFSSVWILLGMAAINFCALKKAWKPKAAGIVLTALFWLLFAYSLFGTAQQLLGTVFEKLCMSLLCIANALMYFRLAVEKRW